MLVTFVSYGQKKMTVDGDKLHLRDSLGGKIILVSSIERGQKNRDALWITYHRRPGLDPWTKDSKDWDENFTKYWSANRVTILGAFTDWDLIHFKIPQQDWIKMKELYPDMVQYVKRIN
jgi:hypothetical protein